MDNEEDCDCVAGWHLERLSSELKSKQWPQSVPGVDKQHATLELGHSASDEITRQSRNENTYSARWRSSRSLNGRPDIGCRGIAMNDISRSRD